MQMSFNKDGFTKINEEAFVYKGFIDEDHADKLKNMAQKSPFKVREIHPIHEIGPVEDKHINEKISGILNPGNHCPGLSLVNTPRGLSWADHTDLDGYDNSVEGNKIFGGIIYLEDFDGGEICYKDYNTEYHPEKGDMVLHSSSVVHSVNEVKSDSRYTINFHIWSSDDI